MTPVKAHGSPMWSTMTATCLGVSSRCPGTYPASSNASDNRSVRIHERRRWLADWGVEPGK